VLRKVDAVLFVEACQSLAAIACAHDKVRIIGNQLALRAPTSLERSPGAQMTSYPSTQDAESVPISSAMRSVRSLIAQIAPTCLPILIQGETGSGKEILAESVHKLSARSDRPLIKINCAGLTESVVESELFGHERGAFTGAVQRHAGLFEVADGGTLMLDEVGELPLRTQAKLLRVLETGELVRVGSTSQSRVDVRVIAATHRDLPRMVELGQMRQDLYFRLNGVTVELPPLRAREDEIIPLALRFLARAAHKSYRGPLQLTARAKSVLRAYPWPGNIRELRNVMERAAALCPGPYVDVDQLVLGRSTFAAPNETSLSRAAYETADPNHIRTALRDFERVRIVEALAQTRGNQTAAAKLLGVSRRTLCNKLSAHGIARPRKRGELPAALAFEPTHNPALRS
jgi:transcriptional regulator with GAF, ATPase, and Fis domain